MQASVTRVWLKSSDLRDLHAVNSAAASSVNRVFDTDSDSKAGKLRNSGAVRPFTFVPLRLRELRDAILDNRSIAPSLTSVSERSSTCIVDRPCRYVAAPSANFVFERCRLLRSFIDAKWANESSSI